MSSISGINEPIKSNTSEISSSSVAQNSNNIDTTENNTKANTADDVILPDFKDGDAADNLEKEGIKACEDARYRKYFKMTQFGVPAEAVKMKMISEGFDASILE